MCRPKLQFRPMAIVTEPTGTFGQFLVKKGALVINNLFEEPKIWDSKDSKNL